MFHLIFLAAGFSRRFGSNKLMYMIDGRPMYRHLLDRLNRIVQSPGSDADLTVVTQYTRIGDELKGEPVFVVFNEDPSRGISSSLQTGIRFLEKRSSIHADDVLVFFTADQPYLKEKTVRDFLEVVRIRHPTLAAVGYEGKSASPCAFSAEWIPKLKKLSGDSGGKQILKRYPEKVFVFDVDSPVELADIDRL